jgi:hypothetical protein
MITNKEIELSRPFVLTPKDITKIYNYFKPTDEIYLKSSCKDGVTRQFESLNELIDYENLPGKEMKSLGITVYSSNLQKVYIRLSKSHVKNINIEIKGGEEEVRNLYEFLENQFHAMAPWYSPFIKWGVKSFIIEYFITIMFMIPVILWINNVRKSGYDMNDYKLYIPLVCAPIIMSAVLRLIKNNFFPAGVFAIGQGKKRHQDADIIRTAIILGFLIEAISAIIFAILI